MPATAKRFGVEDIFDPEENITGGVKFLKYLFDEFEKKIWIWFSQDILPAKKLYANMAIKFHRMRRHNVM